MARQWILNSQGGFEKSLEFQHVDIPKQSDLQPNEVLIKLHAASLNYRELVIAGPVVSFHNRQHDRKY
jgi:NADPH:quinone reductase-like Zn-dependent oxidoreductase